MSLEGNLRDLALAEVCQLLAHTRKSGELRLHAPLADLRAAISFDHGAIVDAVVDGAPAATVSEESALNAAQGVERTALEILSWCEGNFHFVPAEQIDSVHNVRLNTEMILMESTRRSADWARISDRLPNARAIPAFAEFEARQLPLLNLTPQQWEVLTGVDGERDLSALAAALGRDVLDVAEIVHGLLGTGLLRLVGPVRVIRTQVTPPSTTVVRDEPGIDLWAPGESVFPTSRTVIDAVPTPRAQGDAAARRGDFSLALKYWDIALDHSTLEADVVHAREAIVVAGRLQQLLDAGWSE